ncbi:hypothetical protein N7481_003570 [Penicillium waksmanii]|uniref:uncharacterized protein n=1 Tax=Penicillium waksmanii TaxID=69791 RepID=UPI002547D893|nr:uncharacterized protein N7481_003570 [Penicillium waksmanii]KAJ5988360.1 hypothetical protein N7481_003570 [Penicillium waksmanii]
MQRKTGYDVEEDLNPWQSFYSEYHFALTAGRIYVADAKAVASKGRDAGKVLVIWDAIERANLDDCYLKDYSCWEYAQIGKTYEWEDHWVHLTLITAKKSPVSVLWKSMVIGGLSTLSEIVYHRATTSFSLQLKS